MGQRASSRDPRAGRAGSPAAQIGIDMGGSKTHGIRIVQGAVVDEALAGTANVQNVDRPTAAERLGGLLARLGASDPDRVLVGAGGVDTPRTNGGFGCSSLRTPPARTSKSSMTPGSYSQRQGRTRGSPSSPAPDRRPGAPMAAARKPGAGAGATCSATKAAATGSGATPCGTAWFGPTTAYHPTSSPPGSWPNAPSGALRN